MKTNYVLLDYENVQPPSLSILDQEHFKVIVFVGANQTKISLAVATTLQQMGHRASYIQISGSGCNALDFHIAFTIGQLAAAEPDAFFHIISRDTGFDPLIEYLRTKKIRASRSSSLTDIPLVKAAQAVSVSEQIALIISNLQGRGASKPRTVKTLASTINALFQHKLSDGQITALLAELEKQGIIAISDTKISYPSPQSV